MNTHDYSCNCRKNRVYQYSEGIHSTCNGIGSDRAMHKGLGDLLLHILEAMTAQHPVLNR